MKNRSGVSMGSSRHGGPRTCSWTEATLSCRSNSDLQCRRGLAARDCGSDLARWLPFCGKNYNGPFTSQCNIYMNGILTVRFLHSMRFCYKTKTEITLLSQKTTTNMSGRALSQSKKTNVRVRRRRETNDARKRQLVVVLMNSMSWQPQRILDRLLPAQRN